MAASEKSGSAWLKWCWAKTSRDGAPGEGPVWHPLVAHILDTAAVAQELWDRYLPDTVRDRFTEAFGGGNPEHARSIVSFLAALHDLGKASPCFQDMFGTGTYASARIRTARQSWEKKARAAGMPLPDHPGTAQQARHEHLTAALLPRLIGCDCTGIAPSAFCSRDEHHGVNTVALCLGGHHGHIPNPQWVTIAHWAAGGTGWDDVRTALVDAVAAQMGIEIALLPALVRPTRPAVLVLFTGLVVLSDWIASDENRFPYGSPEDRHATVWARSRQRATAAVSALRLDRWLPRTGSAWESLWPGTSPRAFQAAAVGLLPENGQALVIAESETGSGKTRLALWCAYHLAVRNGYQGVYVALPTRAASLQTARELERFLPSATELGAVSLALVHAAAPAEDFVQRLISAAQDTMEAHAEEPEPDGGTPARVVLDPWYLRRCLGLVAAFGAGTVDQVVLGTQGSRHWFLRMFGLMCKTVVIDEVHAYELYQQQLLGAAVEWLADAGASVLVLSATLPADAKAALTLSWCTGLRAPLRDTGGRGQVTVVDGTGVLRRGGPDPAEVDPLHTELSLEPDHGPRALAAELLERARDGGCVGVVRNRVDEAVALFVEARALAEKHGWTPDEVVLLHGRMLPRDRIPVQERVVAFTGPAQEPRRPEGRPNPDRPHRLLVIATQVIEQALDLDFDHLVSDLAPVDLLIQRRGRMHRHPVNDPGRPAWCSEARMRVLYQPDPRNSQLPLVEPPASPEAPGNLDGLVYAPYILAATFRALARRAVMTTEEGAVLHLRMSTPGDSRALLEEVYGPSFPAPEPWTGLLERTWGGWQSALRGEERAARQRVKRPYRGSRSYPVEVAELCSGAASEEGSLSELRAVSRLGDDSHPVVCLYRHGNRLTYDPQGEHPVPMGPADRPVLQRELQLNTLSLPGHWFSGSTPLPCPETWSVVERNLRGLHVAEFDESGRCISLPEGSLRYDWATGMARPHTLP
ncbi:CRISPR-associated helicase Cas3' [Streptomyces sp. NPDC005180]|uniref:CRISPR-associated helicase Cas3' n=1 Tax=Streptomyces sp. NPDC005180 TaxID=3156868 RepID=UPI0033B554C0